MIVQIPLTLATRYPIEGYRPVQEPPNDDLIKGKTLLECLERILPYFMQVRYGYKLAEKSSKLMKTRYPVGNIFVAGVFIK